MLINQLNGSKYLNLKKNENPIFTKIGSAGLLERHIFFFWPDPSSIRPSADQNLKVNPTLSSSQLGIRSCTQKIIGVFEEAGMCSLEV